LPPFRAIAALSRRHILVHLETEDPHALLDFDRQNIGEESQIQAGPFPETAIEAASPAIVNKTRPLLNGRPQTLGFTVIQQFPQ